MFQPCSGPRVRQACFVLFVLALTACGGGGRSGAGGSLGGGAGVGSSSSSSLASSASSASSLSSSAGPTGPTGPTLQLLTGALGGQGYRNASGIDARFYAPTGIAIDRFGTLYVADNCTIRKITPAGLVSTLTGTYGDCDVIDGVNGVARLGPIEGLALDGAGNIYVADSVNRVIRKVTPGGTVSTLAGSKGAYGAANGPGASATFSRPRGLAVGTGPTVYVTDNDLVRAISAAGVVSTLASPNLGFLHGITLDTSGNIFVGGDASWQIFKITPGGASSLYAGSGDLGNQDGSSSTARFSDPAGLAFDASGNLYVADNSGYAIRKIAPDGTVTTLAGVTNASPTSSSGSYQEYVDATGPAARFHRPTGIAVDGTGGVFVSDTGNFAIRKVSASGVTTTFAGRGPSWGSSDGSTTARFGNEISGLTADPSGTLFVADQANRLIRRVTAAGVVTSFAGTPGSLDSVDGTGPGARFSAPAGVASDSLGNLFVTDGPTRIIRKITPAGVVTTFAGANAVCCTTDGTGAAARFYYPYGIGIDSSDNIFVADILNFNIRKITPAALVTTLAGSVMQTSGASDGVGTSAQFNYPNAVAVDLAGNAYVSDGSNCSIRKVTPGGVVSTFAGLSGVCGYADGTGTASRFGLVSAVVFDASGNLYVADRGNSAIRRVTPAGVVTTLIGTPGSAGVLLGARPAGLNRPRALSIVGQRLYIVDEAAILVTGLP